MFVRSLLAMSLSCIIANVALAASTTEQPVTPKKVSAPVEDPIDPLAVDAASTVKAQTQAQAQTQITAQEQNDLNRASTTLQNLQKAEDPNADSGIAASEPTAPAKTTQHLRLLLLLQPFHGH
ncbi:erfK/YbiS/YcfS/YnhG family domain protein [Acinetobacter sp. 1592897]|nr:erfK/YbiS/YcfS/YnhG family domain protein [Acinetobacter sp. 1592897]